MESVRPVRQNPNPQVSALQRVRHRRHSPAPSGQFVEKRLLLLAAIAAALARPSRPAYSPLRVASVLLTGGVSIGLAED
jgi:hypothetical protein